MKIIPAYLLVFVLFGCKEDCHEDLKKDNLVFFAENNDLIGMDRLELFANKVFLFQTTDFKGDGYYSISGDSIFLRFAECTAPPVEAFVVEDDLIFAMRESQNLWKKDEKFFIYIQQNKIVEK